MTAISQLGCRDCAPPRGMRRLAISIGLGLVEWGRKRAETRVAHPSYDEQLRRHDRAWEALMRAEPTGRS